MGKSVNNHKCREMKNKGRDRYKPELDFLKLPSRLFPGDKSDPFCRNPDLHH